VRFLIKMTFSYDPQLSILKSALRNERSMSLDLGP
jgi:hypothetical protein